MTNEVAKKIIRGITDKIECNTVDIDDWAEFWGFTREEYEEFFDMAIKALEQQPCEDCISRQKALDCFEQTNTRQGAKYAIETLPSVIPQTVTEFADKCKECGKMLNDKLQLCEDAVSREAVLDGLANIVKAKAKSDAQKALMGRVMFFTEQLPSVTPRTNLAETSQDCISREEVQDLISRWLSDYLLDETREALETINYKVGDMPSVTPERPKGKWIFHKSFDDGHKNCNECIECNQCHTWLGYDCYAKTRYCPICGSYNGGDEDADSD